ncbi:1-aminocyclopropane-1-carboxylate deaminase/D-cysteine desulfhydrase [Flavobacterium sp.]|uniref:1-aminocyclopropane-1-carboxylate deaminase/D-cysteine desulfhydrase n=1 Tax=Flavobacterium sp. TaxID=239 RepID=UPI003D268458
MIQKINLNNDKNISLFIKREDLLHPLISGNKFRKLKYNLIEAKRKGADTLVTFGGAFSNHILAVAAAGKENGFNTIGVVRGEELIDKVSDNPTLQLAQSLGMKFVFVSREMYKNKSDESFLDQFNLETENQYVIPEGGTNDFAIKGCEEIITEDLNDFTHVCCSVGTGGTISGIINSSFVSQKILGFSSLKGDFLSEQISNFVNKNNWALNTDYHFGGYGKVNDELIAFINEFHKKTNVPLDPIYTGKMVYGVYDLIKKDYFSNNSKILMIHTGGLQGIKGMNDLLRKKNKEIINYDF